MYITVQGTKVIVKSWQDASEGLDKILSRKGITNFHLFIDGKEQKGWGNINFRPFSQVGEIEVIKIVKGKDYKGK